MNKNYADETIPNQEELLKEVKLLAENVGELEKYSFLDLFKEVERKGKVEYHRENSIWGETILYNTWLKNAHDETKKPEEDRKRKNEVQGMYIFYENNIPIYIGISRAILRRLKHHFLGKIHNEATLAYLILRDEYDKTHDLYNKKRELLPTFTTGRELLQKEMRSNWKISIIPETDNYKMYFYEIYLACQLNTKWNSFETH